MLHVRRSGSYLNSYHEKQLNIVELGDRRRKYLKTTAPRDVQKPNGMVCDLLGNRSLMVRDDLDARMLS